jgi:hypothetical protein
MKINNNNFGAAVYGSNESGQIAIQSCRMGEIYQNYFHDVGFFQMASICGESDFGGTGWIIHHNVCYQGDSSVYSDKWGKPTYLRCCDWTPTTAADDPDFMCFNNTIVDSSSRDHWDWETMTNAFGDGQPWPGVFNKNNLWGWTLPDTASWKYTNPVKRDYSLRAGSPAIDKGVVIPGWVETYKGAAPDLGAFEYGDTPWVAGPDWTEIAWEYPPRDLSVGHPLEMKRSDRIAPIRVSRMGDNVVLNAPEAQDRTVMVFDTRGQVVYRAQWTRGETALVLDTRGWSNHVYMIRMVSQAGVTAGKLYIGR